MKEAGRKEKARLTRQLFEAKRKKLAGEELTEEDIKVLSEPKAERYLQEDSGKGKPAVAAGKGAKSAPVAVKKQPVAPAKKDQKETQKEEEAKKEVVFPKSEDHPMIEARNFLKHMEQPRTSVLELSENGKPRVRDLREFEEIYESCLMTKEDTYSMMDRLAKRKDDLKEQREKVVYHITKVYESHISKYTEEIEANKKKLEELKESFLRINEENSKKKENEDALLNLLAAENPTETALKDAITKAKEAQVDLRIVGAAEKYLKNTIIKNAGVTLKEKLDTFDEAGATQMKEFIEKHNIMIEEDLRSQMEDFFASIAANPNFIAEKQAELKKQPKTKRK